MLTMTQAVTVISTAGLLAASGLAYAQTTSPTQADFDRCNRQALAAAKTAAPSASPGGMSSPTPSPSPGVGAPSPGAPSAPSGSVASTPVPSDPSASPSTGSLPSAGDSSSDPLLRGMASTGLNDPAYQRAYRDCLMGR